MATSDKLIQVHGLKKYYNKGALHALDDVSVDINKGDVMVVIGPSGSGKSTFLRSLNLMEEPTDGEIIFHNIDITKKKFLNKQGKVEKVDINLHRQKMGMVFQHFNLFPHKTILENMTLAPIKVLKMAKAAAEEKAIALLNRVGLGDRADAYPIQLSGGQKQRVAIARAILRQSPIIILDEATASVDVQTERQIQAAINNMAGKRTIVAIAHRLSTIKNADLILVIHEGEIKEQGSHEELLALGGIYAQMLKAQE